MWSCAFLANVISGIISTLQLWCDCSMLSTESPQVAWEENSRVDTSRHGIQTWQLEHFLGPNSPGPDLSAGLLGRESRQGSQCTESSVSPRNSSVWTKYFSPFLSTNIYNKPVNVWSPWSWVSGDGEISKAEIIRQQDDDAGTSWELMLSWWEIKEY